MAENTSQDGPAPGINLQAAESMVAAMREVGRLEQVDDALVAAALSLAAAVDLLPGDARLWGQYQAAVKALRDVGKDDGVGDEVERIIAALRGSAEVVDSEDGSPDAGRRGRKSR